MASSNFYIGRLFDLASGKLQEQNVESDPSNLTSPRHHHRYDRFGKPVWVSSFSEEAALHNIPALS